MSVSIGSVVLNVSDIGRARTHLDLWVQASDQQTEVERLVALGD